MVRITGSTDKTSALYHGHKARRQIKIKSGHIFVCVKFIFCIVVAMCDVVPNVKTYDDLPLIIVNNIDL